MHSWKYDPGQPCESRGSESNDLLPPRQHHAHQPIYNINTYNSSGSGYCVSGRMDTRLAQDWTTSWRMFIRLSAGWTNNHPFDRGGYFDSDWQMQTR